MYRVNTTKFRELINAHGDQALAKASLGTRVSVSLLEKMYAGTYDHTPRQIVREKLSQFFKVKETELFLFVGAKKKARAS